MAATRRLGRQPRIYDPRVPHMSALLAGRRVPPPPPQCDYTTDMPQDLGEMLNDQLGDCTCAGIGHGIQVWTFNAGGMMVSEPDALIEKLYEEACGYVPGNEDTDNGGVEQHVLSYLLNTGMILDDGERNKVLGYVEIDPRNILDVKSGIADCGFVYIGFNVPAFIMPSDAVPPLVWDVKAGADDDIIGGHAVILPGYTAQDVFRVISWGERYQMTRAFFDKYVDEVYAIWDEDWINVRGTTPAGLTLQQLEQQMRFLKRPAL